MQYENIREGIFIRRINRFVADVRIDGITERVHIVNTGRLRELLQEGNKVFLEHKYGETRKTQYDLVAVMREDGKLINIDSFAPNRMASEWIRTGGLGDLTAVRTETTLGDSRFDLTALDGNTPVVIEVKGCTLERNGIAYFPDAPTVRGTKHVNGLAKLVKQGYRCVVIIVIQMDGVKAFMPNRETDERFAEALWNAQEAGVEVIAVQCNVNRGKVMITNRVPIIF